MKKQVRIVWSLVIPVCLGFSDATATAQPIVRSFEGDRGPGLAVCQTGVSHCGFPDMDAAVNGKQVVQVTWQNVRVYGYDGHLIQSTPLTKFMGDAGLNPIPPERRNLAGPSVPGPIEPHTVYDEFIDRWIVTATGASDSFLVSTTPDAMGSWRGVNLACLQGGPCLDFDPAMRLGYDKNGAYYCGAHMGDDNPNTIPKIGYDCLAVPSAEVQAIGAGKPPSHITRVHNMPLDILPAIDHNPEKASDAPAFFMTKTCDRVVMGGCQNSINYPFQWVVETFTWNGPTGTFHADGEQTVRTDVGSKRDKWLYSKPCCGRSGVIPQAGNDATSLRTVESHRLTNLVQFGSHLYAALPSGPCSKDCGSQGTDTNNVLFWCDVDCTKTAACVVRQTGKIAGDFNPAFATVGADAAGNLGIVAMSSTVKTDLSILLWTRRKSDPPNSISGPVTVVAGTQPYTCETNTGFASVGNPAGILTSLDPSEGTRLWTTAQWGNDAAPCVWNTRIVSYQIVPARRAAVGSRPARRKRP